MPRFRIPPVLFLSLCSLAATAFGQQNTSPADSESVTTSGHPELTVAEPVVAGNMVIFPVVSAIPLEDNSCITLDEALRQGQVEVLEDGGQVGRVLVRNLAAKPLYLMAGELLLGGRQDRSIAEEIQIAAGSPAVSVRVYCVERGRWTPRDADSTLKLVERIRRTTAGRAEATASAYGGTSLATAFVASPGILSRRPRFAVQSGLRQSIVWGEVSRSNGAADTKTTTDTFVAGYTSNVLCTRIREVVETAQEKVASQTNVVGVVIAVDGRPVISDVFGSTPLFLRLWPKLLRSYVLDAVADGASGDGLPECTAAVARQFLFEDGDSSPTAGQASDTKQGTQQWHTHRLAARSGGSRELVHTASYALKDNMVTATVSSLATLRGRYGGHADGVSNASTFGGYSEANGRSVAEGPGYSRNVTTASSYHGRTRTRGESYYGPFGRSEVYSTALSDRGDARSDCYGSAYGDTYSDSLSHSFGPVMWSHVSGTTPGREVMSVPDSPRRIRSSVFSSEASSDGKSEDRQPHSSRHGGE